MEGIAEKHKYFVFWMTKLYDTLIAMRYISATDVVQPPHSTQAIATATFQTFGYELEVIELMRSIPALHSDTVWGWQNQGTEIIPRSKVVNYFVNENDDWAAYLRCGDFAMGENHTLLPPRMLRLTVGDMYSGQYGTDLIYDTQNHTVVEWSRVGHLSWEESPSRPAEVVLSEIVERLATLEWVPHIDPDDEDLPKSREMIQNPIVFQNVWPMGIRVPEEPQAAVDFLEQELGHGGADYLRRDITRWRAIQKLYKDCGWGICNFNEDKFEESRANWVREWNRCRNQELDYTDMKLPHIEQ